jgi:hypothetical protein
MGRPQNRVRRGRGGIPSFGVRYMMLWTKAVNATTAPHGMSGGGMFASKVKLGNAQAKPADVQISGAQVT